MPFAWGRHDCATWVADVRRALTGQDAAVAWRGRYATARGAWRELRRQGHGDLAMAVSAILGPCMGNLLEAQRGDIVAMWDEFAAHPNAIVLGVCMGGQSAFLGRCGLEWRPTEDSVMAWRV